MDKGYDSEEIHILIRDTLNSCSLIPIRKRKRTRISGYFRLDIVKYLDSNHYNQRNKVETVFSVLKRKFSESLISREYRFQVKEMKIKVILCNLSRWMNFIVFSLSSWNSPEPNEVNYIIEWEIKLKRKPVDL